MPTVTARDPNAVELRAVAPLIALGSAPAFLGPITLVQNAGKIVGVTSVDLLRPVANTPLAVVTLDGATRIAVKAWSAGRYTGLGLVELEGAIPAGADIEPVGIGAVCASVDTRGAPAALVTIVPRGPGFERVVVPVHIDTDDGGGMADTVTRLASAMDAAQSAVVCDGASLFAWFPPDPALGRKSEVLFVGVAVPYRAALVQPRGTPVLGELVGLDDLGRALIAPTGPDERPELSQVAGEIDK